MFKNDFITNEYYYGNLFEEKVNNSGNIKQMKASIKN